MFIKHAILLLVLCISSISYGLPNDPTIGCPNCDNNNNEIIDNGNHEYSATSAQAYYWEICNDGGASSIVAEITGINTDQNVTVNVLDTGDYTIRLTRFVNGVCEESCLTYVDTVGPPVFPRDTITPGDPDIPLTGCPTSNNINFYNEGGSGTCATGIAFVSGISDIIHIDWSWAIGPYSGTMTSTGNSTPVYYPSSNWNNHYMVICAEVTTNDGTIIACPEVCKSFMMDCGTGLGDPIGGGGPGGGPGSGGDESIIFPNPSKDGTFSIEALGDKRIKEVVITNGQGTPVKVISKEIKSTIDLSRERNGLYFVKILFEDGKTEVQQLQLEK